MSLSESEKQYRLPGGRATVSSRMAQVRALRYGSGLFGIRYLNLLAAARSGDRARLRRSERSWAARAIVASKLKVDVSGLEHIDPSKQYVVAPLHEGFADILALLQLPMDLSFSATDELFDWTMIGRFLRASNHTALPRNNGAMGYRAMARAAEAAFSVDESYVVFPQGSILGIETAFHQGAFHLAKRMDHPLLPIVLTGGAMTWQYPFSANLAFGQTIHLEVLEPIPADQAVIRSVEIEATMKDLALLSTPGPRRFDPTVDGWWDDYPYEIDPRFDELAGRINSHRSRATSEAAALLQG